MKHNLTSYHQNLQTRGGDSIYYNGPHELWNIAGGQQKLLNFILKFYLSRPKENKDFS